MRVWLGILEGMSVWGVDFSVLDKLFFWDFGIVIHKELHHLC
jgi:hypothetical protein